jgi:hypothetical protein
LTISIDIAKALLLDGHPEDMQSLKDASITLNWLWRSSCP